MSSIMEGCGKAMTEDSLILLKELAYVLKENSSRIISGWVDFYASYNINNLYQDYAEALDGVAKILNNYISYFDSGESDGFHKANKMLAENMAAKYISWEAMEQVFRAFEASCSNIFDDSKCTCDAIDRIAEYQRIMNKTINEVFNIFLKAFLEVKDTDLVALAKMAEYHDSETSKHLIRTREYAALLAKELNKGEQFTKCIYKAGPLHDIGKIGISENILQKKGKLSKEEFEEVKKHTVIGGELISQAIRKQNKSKYYITALEIAMYHHEWFDGRGYPKGLTGNQIPISARIFAVADVYDALVSKRCYKEALPHDSAVEIIKSETGQHFDPEIIKVFLKVQDKFLMIKDQYSSDNM